MISMFSKKILIIIGLFFVFSISFQIENVFAKELQVGVSPILLDLGTLEKGEPLVGSFYIVTSSPDEIIVKLKTQKIDFDFFKKPINANIINFVSEEKIIDWISYPDNPYVLKSKNETLKTTAGSISDWKKINFVLDVPKDAEPCYHAFKINPSPYAAKESNNGVSIIAMTAITVKFNVEGNCVIEGNIIDAVQSESNNDRINIGIYFQNIGTATITANSPGITIAFENGTILDTANSGYVSIAPNDVGILYLQFDSKKALPGSYVLNAKVLYGTNEPTKQIKLNITKPEKSIKKQTINTTLKDRNYNY